MTLLNDIKKKGNILAKDDLYLLQERCYVLEGLISSRILYFGLPKSKNDIIFSYINELKDIHKFLKKCLKEINYE